jgi:hypothetical protein
MRTIRFSCLSACALLVILLCGQAVAQKSSHDPTWWDKYQFLLNNAEASLSLAPSVPASVGGNVDVSNECFPQSETYITLNPNQPKMLAAGSNEIFRDPMRGYFSKDGGKTWGGVDLPLPDAKGSGGQRFGSDPTLAFDTRGNVFYGYIVVFFSKSFGGINGTGMAVARSTDGGKTYPQVTFFGFEGGTNHFNDKPMITADTSVSSPFRDNVYIAWDAASGGSGGGGIRVARSSDQGASFTINRADDPNGPGRSIGAVPFAGPNGELYVAWNNYAANTIAFNRSFDGGVTWDTESVISAKSIPFDIAIPAEFRRAALVYPACDTDRSSGSFRGRLYCSWMDLKSDGTTDILLSYSDDRGSKDSWSRPASVGDQLSFPVDRFNQWLSVDPVTGEVNVSFYDTRNDTTGSRYMTDTYLATSTDGGQTFGNVRVSDVSSNEHDCNGVFPCAFINYGNQQGDYEGLVSYGGISHPIWTDSRRNSETPAACVLNGSNRGLMEEVFTATVK